MADRAVCIRREQRSGIHLVHVEHHGWRELILSAEWGERSSAKVLEDVHALVAEHQMQMVSEEILGLPADPAAFMKGAGADPCTWVVGDSLGLGGVQLWAVSGVRVEPVRHDGRVVGVVFEDEHARWCRLGDVRPSAHSTAEDSLQAAETFQIMQRALQSAGMDFSNVVRTWFYNRDILRWYPDFNTVRTSFFRKHGVFERMVPASTGIGASNGAGTALVAGALAVALKSNVVRTTTLPSSLQCPALSYGSSFSRAVELTMPGLRRVLVSGTASIEPGGNTAHVGCVDAQVDLTMRVVAAILESRHMKWTDVVRGIVYVRRAEDVGAFRRYCEWHDLPAMPMVMLHSVVCRDDLLFELEVDAASPVPG